MNPFLAETPGGSGPTRGTLVAAGGIVVALAAGAWFVLAGGGSGGGKAPAPAKPSAVAPTTAAAVAAPAVPSVAPLGEAPTRELDLGAAPKLSVVLPKLELFVEQARGHRFTKPLAVTPLGNKAFVAALIKADGVSKPNADAGASPKGLHLLPPDFDANAPGSYDDIGGFYDSKTKHLYVRSITLNPLAQSIIAHEMTHALDDEYFDLTKIQRAGENSDQDEAIRSLIEGDARAVENRFNKALTTQRKAQEDAERSALLGAIEAQAGGGAPSPFVLSCSACSRTRSAPGSSTSWSTTADRPGSTKPSASRRHRRCRSSTRRPGSCTGSTHARSRHPSPAQGASSTTTLRGPSRSPQCCRRLHRPGGCSRHRSRPGRVTPT